jgi:hypothetical protein
MRRDAESHGNPALFYQWASNGSCPYKNQDRFWLFEPKKRLWSPGPPTMTDKELIEAILKSHNWKVEI